MDFVQECVLQAEEKFWLPEEQKVERNCQLRPQTLWSFLLYGIIYRKAEQRRLRKYYNNEVQ